MGGDARRRTQPHVEFVDHVSVLESLDHSLDTRKAAYDATSPVPRVMLGTMTMNRKSYAKSIPRWTHTSFVSACGKHYYYKDTCVTKAGELGIHATKGQCSEKGRSGC
jgi:hypothetical protein